MQLLKKIYKIRTETLRELGAPWLTLHDISFLLPTTLFMVEGSLDPLLTHKPFDLRTSNLGVY